MGVENKCMNTKGERGGEREIGKELYLMHCGNLNRREVQKGGDICMRIADSFCAVEANTTL